MNLLLLSRFTSKSSNALFRSHSRRMMSGISFQLNEDQKSFQAVARQFANDEMIPVASKYDATGQYPEEVFRKAWELGLVNTHVEEAYGGLHMDCLTNCVVMEELARGLVFVLVLIHSIADFVFLIDALE